MDAYDFSATWARSAAGAALALACAAAGAVTPIRTAGQTATEPKFIAITRDGVIRVEGLCIDIMRAIERVDPSLKFVGDQDMQPLIRVEAGLAKGELDAACGFFRNPLREHTFLFVEPPLFPVKYYLTVRANDDVKVGNWDDVRKLGKQGVILAMHGFAVNKRLDDIGGLHVDAGANSSGMNFQKLLAGRGRFYYHRSPGIMAEIRNAGVLGKVKVLPASMDEQKLYMVLSRFLADDAVRRMRAAIAQLDKSGELAKLLAKWSEG